MSAKEESIEPARPAEIHSARRVRRLAGAETADVVLSAPDADAPAWVDTALLNKVHTALLGVDSNGRILFVNQALERISGYTSSDLRGQELVGLIPVLSTLSTTDFLMRQSHGGRWVPDRKLELRLKNGRTVAVAISVEPIERLTGTAYLLTVLDRGEQQRIDAALFNAKEASQIILEAVRDGVIVTDRRGLVEYVNPVAQKLTGWSSRGAQSRPIKTVFHAVAEATGQTQENPLLVCIREGCEIVAPSAAVLTNHKTGAEFVVNAVASPIHDAHGQLTGAVLVFHDASDAQHAHSQFSYAASHDSLTGLMNGSEFARLLEKEISHCGQSDGLTHVLLNLDLDGFRLVNETHGHAAGDQMLKDVASLLKQKVRSSDVLVRLGDDSFGVLLENCAQDRAIEIAEDLCQAIWSMPFVWKEQVFEMTVSIGVVVIRNESESAAQVLSAADAACETAKERGCNRVELYRELGGRSHRQRAVRWVSRLTKACEENRLMMYCQPILPIGNYRDTHGHFELLLRLRDENNQIVSPGVFLPAAERYDLMPTIDRWVVRYALRNLVCAQSPSSSEPDYTLSINLSGTSLSDERFLEYVVGEVKRATPVAGSICFEISETAAINNLSRVAQFMAVLKAYGCLFSLDNFGSGLSSLTYLKTLPVDFLKIDGHFIKNIAHDKVDCAFVDAINQIGQVMGIRTVAECVEDQAALDQLTATGINYAQGFHLAMPSEVQDRSTFVPQN